MLMCQQCAQLAINCLSCGIKKCPSHEWCDQPLKYIGFLCLHRLLLQPASENSAVCTKSFLTWQAITYRRLFIGKEDSVKQDYVWKVLLGYKNILRGVVRLIFDFTLLSPHPTNGLNQCRCNYWKVIVFFAKEMMLAERWGAACCNSWLPMGEISLFDVHNAHVQCTLYNVHTAQWSAHCTWQYNVPESNRESDKKQIWLWDEHACTGATRRRSPPWLLTSCLEVGMVVVTTL